MGVTYNYEKVPETDQRGGVVKVLLELQGACEDCDKVRGTEVA